MESGPEPAKRLTARRVLRARRRQRPARSRFRWGRLTPPIVAALLALAAAAWALLLR